jgi:hypothetical protein
MYALLIVVCPFVLFLLAIVLFVLLRYMDSDYLPLVSSNSSNSSSTNQYLTLLLADNNHIFLECNITIFKNINDNRSGHFYVDALVPINNRPWTPLLNHLNISDLILQFNVFTHFYWSYFPLRWEKVAKFKKIEQHKTH